MTSTRHSGFAAHTKLVPKKNKKKNGKLTRKIKVNQKKLRKADDLDEALCFRRTYETGIKFPNKKKSNPTLCHGMLAAKKKESL